MIIQLYLKGEKLKELDICFQIIISFVWSIDLKYVNKYVIYSKIHQTLLPKQQMQKLKILLIIADVNLVAKEFQQHEYCHKKQPSLPSKLDYSS